jgi:hypothetical protein
MNHLKYIKQVPLISQTEEPDIQNWSGIINSDELINLLETDFKTLWQTFEIRQPIGEIRKFGQSLADLGKEHNAGIVSKYGLDLKNAADTFDVKAVINLIRQYPNILEKIKSGLKK